MAKRRSMISLRTLHHVLLEKQQRRKRKGVRYRIPSLWLKDAGSHDVAAVNPFQFYAHTIGEILDAPSQPIRRSPPTAGEWTRDAVIYNVFVRTTAAFDHNGNGVLDLPVNDDGFRETGTFLKLIALLPYIKGLGANTIHLLPITSIGHDGNKGSLGSPYAIRNPYELDENLSEPVLGLDVKTEFKAFVEAAHHMGLRVVVEFVFRTAAKDSDWVREHPEWFYWIREEVEIRDPQHMDESKYGSPIFLEEELARIHHDVDHHRYHALVPPHRTHQEFFTNPPKPGTIAHENGGYIGTTEVGQRVKIPGAFADWPPDDNQPPWGDVTYLRMYDHPDFNYIAYNTIRMYDSRLARQEHANRPLWERVIGIIPYYQKEFHIDGVMIDMGHALPNELKKEMIATARGNDPDFAFWDEDFSITRRSREEGYNSVIGFLWIDENHPEKIKDFVRTCSQEGWPIPSFATPESHNTPRAASRNGGVAYSRWSWVVNNFLPAIPFIHSGFELAETFPINTGLDFTVDQIRSFPSERLPLFSEYHYDWGNPDAFTDWITRIAELRKRYAEHIVDAAPASIVPLECSNAHFLAFARIRRENSVRIAVISNMNFINAENGSVRITQAASSVKDLISGESFTLNHDDVTVTLEPGQCIVFEY